MQKDFIPKIHLLYHTMEQTQEKGMDSLLAQIVKKSLEMELGKQVIAKIEDRLSEKFDSDLYDAVLNFQKIDLILREFYGKGADSLEKKILENLFEIHVPKQDKKDKEHLSIVTLKDQSTSEIILNLVGDYDVRRILNILSKNKEKQNMDSMTKQEIIQTTDMSQTVGYAKIDNLIRCGLLEIKEYGESKIDKRRVAKYQTAFKNLKINVTSSGDVNVDLYVDDETIKKSTILSVVGY